MYIDANEIIKLIEIAKECQEKLPKEEQWIHVNDIAATLQNLIDAESARMEKMADDFEAEEYGRLELEEAAIQKESRVDFNWPYGV